MDLNCSSKGLWAQRMFKPFVLVTLAIACTGCQLTSAPEVNRFVEDRAIWQQQAKVISSGLNNFGITVEARVQVVSEEPNKRYELTDIKLIDQMRHSELDLLRPNFSAAYDCNSRCMNLSAVDNSAASLGSPLSDLLDSQRTQLSEFYKQMQELNQRISWYQNESPEVLVKYLRYLVRENHKAANLAEFVSYLDNALSAEKLASFITSNFTSTKSANTLIGPAVETGAMAQTQNKKRRVDAAMADWMDLEEMTGDQKLHNQLLEQKEQSLAGSYSKKTRWRTAKKETLTLGATACTFSSNEFGIVYKIDRNQVTLELLGEAQILVDGIKQTPEAGYFYTGVSEFYYQQVEQRDRKSVV